MCLRSLAIIFFFFYQQVSSGEIAPFSLVQVEVVFNPTKSGNALAEFEISFSDPLSPPVSESFVRNTVLLGWKVARFHSAWWKEIT